MAILCLALAGWLAWTAWPGVQVQDEPVTDVHTFARWRGDGHDWLLKAEPGQGTLVVYDARDGRPLRRLPVAGVNEIVLQGNWLFVLCDTSPGLRLLRLPQLTWRHDGQPDASAPRSVSGKPAAQRARLR